MAELVGGAGDDVLVGTGVGDITRLSVDANGEQIAYYNGWDISSDGTKLLLSDSQVYVKDLITGATTVISTSSDGVAGNRFSDTAIFSPDGTKVLFRSDSFNLVPGDTNEASDFFLKDLVTGVLTRVSTSSSGQQSDYGSYNKPAFSPDGNKIAFYGGGNLITGSSDVFGLLVKDLTTGTVTLVASQSFTPTFSADGGKIGYSTPRIDSHGYTQDVYDVYVKNLTTGVVTQVSTDSAGNQANGGSGGLAFSPDGSKVMFSSSASNLVAGDTNGVSDIFVKDLITGEVVRVSTSATGVQGNGGSANGSFAGNGSVVFFSSASNLAPDDTNGVTDAFIKDLTSGVVTRLATSRWAWSSDPGFSSGFLSADRTKLYFDSWDPNLVRGDTNNGPDVFVKDLVGNGHDVLSGGDGNDRLEGRGANDELHGGTGNDVILGDDFDSLTADGSDILFGDEGDDVLIGGLGDDVLVGGAGNDILVNGMGQGVLTAGVASLGSSYIQDGGKDQIDGGAGFDTAHLYFYGRVGGIVLDNSNASAVNTVWINGVASGAVTGVESIVVYAGTGDDTITGGIGDDTFAGWGGVDIFNGGAGVDTAAYYTNTPLSVVVTLNGDVAANVTLGGVAGGSVRNIENVIGDDAADSLTGDGLANALTGNGGNDTLVGMGGSDLLAGGAGNDRLDGGAGVDTASYLFAAAGVGVNLNVTGAQNTVGDGVDTLISIENLIGSKFGDVLIGDGLANRLEGGDGDDLLLGGLGDDYLNGGAGVDTAIYLTATAGVTVSLAQPNAQTIASAGTDILVSIENLIGSAYGDVLYGDGGANTLEGRDGADGLGGGAGDDVLDGGAGSDYMVGGAGNDSYVVESFYDAVVEAAGEGTDVVYASVSYGLGANVEVLYLGPDGDLNGVGNDIANTLVGNTHDNYLTGLAGDDALMGGDGNDHEYGGEGDDYLYGQNGDDWLVGDAGFDRLYGQAGVDVMIGGGGDDLMVGWIGDDGYVVDSGGDLISENPGQGVDVVYAYANYVLAANVENLWLFDGANGGAGNAGDNLLVANLNLGSTLYGLDGADALVGENGGDFLYGGTGNDFLNGQAGADTLVGGQGSDYLYGGTGADTFLYAAVSDSVGAAGNMDAIMDFEIGVDKVNLHGVLGGVGDAVSLMVNSDGTYILVDLGGNGSEDMRILLYHTTGVQMSDLVL